MTKEATHCLYMRLDKAKRPSGASDRGFVSPVESRCVIYLIEDIHMNVLCLEVAAALGVTGG